MITLYQNRRLYTRRFVFAAYDTSHIETEQYYMNMLSEDLKPIVSDLRTAHMKDNDTASDVDYQSHEETFSPDQNRQKNIES